MFINRHHNKEAIEKMRKAKMGEKNSMFGNILVKKW